MRSSDSIVTLNILYYVMLGVAAILTLVSDNLLAPLLPLMVCIVIQGVIVERRVIELGERLYQAQITTLQERPE